MKTFKQLTEAQKERAIKRCLSLLLEDLDDLVANWGQPDDLESIKAQEAAQAAIAKAVDMGLPSYAFIEPIRKELEAMALDMAEGNLYSEPFEFIDKGIISIEDWEREQENEK